MNLWGRGGVREQGGIEKDKIDVAVIIIYYELLQSQSQSV